MRDAQSRRPRDALMFITAHAGFEFLVIVISGLNAVCGKT